MVDEQPQSIPSEGAEVPDGATPEPVSDESQEKSSPGWWQRLFGRRPTAQEARTEDGEPGATGGTSAALQLTQEELDRRVQSEADRREAQRAARQKVEERKKLRDTDPWAYAEQERKEEEAQSGNFQIERFVTDLGSAHDRVTVDPIFLTLPKAEQERIVKLEGAGQGLEGRKLVVQESLKALEKHWKAEGAKDAEAKLRRNPAFRKQVLAELRGQTPEPELLPSGAASDADRTVSGLLRDYYRLG
jgi:hypothetical protein